MTGEAKYRKSYTKADPIKWPIQIQQTPYGWTVTCFNSDGHARHIASAENEMQALRSALNMAKAYHYPKRALLSSEAGSVEKDLDRLVKR
jgi:phosphoketolase